MTATLRINLTRSIAILIFIAASIILTTPIYAEEATKSSLKREKVQERIEAKKDKIENRLTAVKEKHATREAALKAKLEKFKDQKKAQIAERVNQNLNKINENQTTQMQNHLSKMSELVEKLETRVNQGTSDIKDPVAAKSAIANARASIATASSAVTAQAEKDYTIKVSTETKVKTDAQQMRDLLKNDLMVVRKLVIGAKQSVSEAIRTAKSNSVKETTGSGQ